ncbi:NAD(P)-dependent oxidoreductase [Streptomyces caatingaensis]|uniref:6-phosphogluconate dehydrogenase n=1 Tax=Streptomyces caatingaensis TaxID=1678637 RepID=A0A0K9XHD8_9ACTN|nr:NAD(P)-binding domain-containing protein [Streptomyces caatingaensis]KNB52097.1 6-phosphogluconate dehydrogenase [Streptomyces caatingaensis]
MGTEVSVLGLGAMGSALAGAFLAAGHRTTVWNRTPAKAEPPAARGAERAGSAAEALAASPLAVVCVSTYDAVLDVLEPAAAALAGRTVVNLTSGPPGDGRQTAEWAARHGVAGYLDGVVMSTPAGIGRPDALLLHAGPVSVFEAHRPVLAALGDPVHVGEDHGLPSVYDTALLGLMWGALTGWLHSTALMRADPGGGGVTATAFTEVAGRWMKTVGAFMDEAARQVDSGRTPGGDFPLDLHLMTMDILVHASELRGIDAGFPELVRELVRKAVDDGHGGDGYARLIGYLRKR